MKTVIVAGAGHGGLCAAIHLAGHGYRVTVLERQTRTEMGYDWHDVVRRDTFTRAQLPMPDESLFLPGEHMCYYSTNKRVKVVSPRLPGHNTVYMDRKALLSHLIECAEQKGVTFLFSCRILDAVCDERSVRGVRYEAKGEIRTLHADLVIDAAGVYSPVRKSLPEAFGVRNELSTRDLFFAWRGYFAASPPCRTDPAYRIYFFHCGTPGMDWVMTRDDHADILIGADLGGPCRELGQSLAVERVQRLRAGDGENADMPLFFKLYHVRPPLFCLTAFYYTIFIYRM